MEPLLSFSSKILIACIQLYRHLVSPLLGMHCRFNPTCSLYGIEVLHRFNLLKGSWLITKRILKCHPLYHGGDDPIPSSELFNIKDN